jgi:ABC-type branched-subunit amino acid transport system ATPase component
MLELRDVSSGYGQASVIRDVRLQVGAGEMVGLLGRNGTGKTTLLRTIFGLADRHRGEVSFDGRPVPAGRPDLLGRWGAAMMPEDRGVFPNLSVADNLRLATRRDHLPPVDPRDIFPLLTSRAKQPAGTLSGGQQQQLGIARAMLAGRRMIVVDELTQGLQPSLAHATLTALRKAAATGVAVLVVDQHAGALLDHCDRALVMQAGRVVHDGPSDPAHRTTLDDLLKIA